jgi:hypothetical protein
VSACLRSLTPADRWHQAIQCSDVAFSSEDGFGSAKILISRLYHAACRPPVYASQPGSSPDHATLGSGR